MSLFDCSMDYARDVFRNIRGIKKSQDLFDDLSNDPMDWEAANSLEIYTHPPLQNAQIIQRAFDYSKNDFIDYPFEHITQSRYSDGSIAVWYGSETMETSIYETAFHFMKEIMDAPDAFSEESFIQIDRRIAKVNCCGLAFDLSPKADEFPWLIDPVNYTKCQEIGRRVATEGHPLLRVPSARHDKGINIVVFSQQVLSNPREFCKLQYKFDLTNNNLMVFRNKEQVKQFDFFINELNNFNITSFMADNKSREKTRT
ncbi:RES family NAD+ phosphorylase [Legionella israelensis]|uniref:RES family NAD+ phosphorylase n=1 Tax=Legionella israelensis TaxID=454 RepID=UPI001FD42C7F|nr:RES family NAD+ phosphorylase [Legionella israelensis]